MVGRSLETRKNPLSEGHSATYREGADRLHREAQSIAQATSFISPKLMVARTGPVSSVYAVLPSATSQSASGPACQSADYVCWFSDWCRLTAPRDVVISRPVLSDTVGSGFVCSHSARTGTVGSIPVFFHHPASSPPRCTSRWWPRHNGTIFPGAAMTSAKPLDR